MTRKTTFFEGWFWFKFNSLGLTLGVTLKFYTSVTKISNLKIKKFLGLFSTFVEVCPPQSWIGLTTQLDKEKNSKRKSLSIDTLWCHWFLNNLLSLLLLIYLTLTIRIYKSCASLKIATFNKRANLRLPPLKKYFLP